MPIRPSTQGLSLQAKHAVPSRHPPTWPVKRQATESENDEPARQDPSTRGTGGSARPRAAPAGDPLRHLGVVLKPELLQRLMSGNLASIRRRRSRRWARSWTSASSSAARYASGVCCSLAARCAAGGPLGDPPRVLRVPVGVRRARRRRARRRRARRRPRGRRPTRGAPG
jgi:hypothetical protein